MPPHVKLTAPLAAACAICSPLGMLWRLPGFFGLIWLCLEISSYARMLHS
jgi:hypothetical protein